MKLFNADNKAKFSKYNVLLQINFQKQSFFTVNQKLGVSLKHLKLIGMY